MDFEFADWIEFVEVEEYVGVIGYNQVKVVGLCSAMAQLNRSHWRMRSWSRLWRPVVSQELAVQTIPGFALSAVLIKVVC